MLKKVEKIAVMTRHGGDKIPRIHLFTSLAKAVDFFDEAMVKRPGDNKPKWIGELQIEEHE
jgi:hypothetical protein